MRKDYIDNIRIICILLLFPFHTFAIYNNWGEAFYIHGAALAIPSWFNSLVYPWWMTLLFAIAGISSAYALKKRSTADYARERTLKLFIPLLVGLIVVIPVQCYIADVFHNGYKGDYFSHYKIFFTRFTDLTGYDGGFTPGHLWFMLFLFIISMIMLPLMNWYNKSNKRLNGEKITLKALLPLFLVILILTPVLEFSGKSIGEALACFAIGFFVLSLDGVQDRLEKNAIFLGSLFLLSLIIRVILQETMYGRNLIWDIEQRVVTWFGILAILGLGKKFMNTSNSWTKYFSRAAFPLYYIHQSILVIIGFFTLKYIKNVPGQMLIIMVGTFVLSLIAYEILRFFRVTSFLFGIKHRNTSI